jgi:hypothetical protein
VFVDVLQSSGLIINTTMSPNKPKRGVLNNIIEYENIPEKFYQKNFI